MFRIVDVHVAEGARAEYVVLQNLGIITVSLRGWAVCTGAYLDGDTNEIASQMYVFKCDVPVNPYTRVVLFTGSGEDGWMPTVDGREAYCAYWNRHERIWSHATHIHVLRVSGSRSIKETAAEHAIAV